MLTPVCPQPVAPRVAELARVPALDVSEVLLLRLHLLPKCCHFGYIALIAAFEGRKGEELEEMGSPDGYSAQAHVLPHV